MKKGKIIMVLGILSVFSFSGCGQQENENSQKQKATEEKETVLSSEEILETTVTTAVIQTTDTTFLDLTGQWVQENADSKSSYMVAEIREDGKIGVFFNLEDDDTPWTYWVGTYEQPIEADGIFTWTSQNTYAGNGLLSSSDKTKTFTYKDNILSFPVTIQGETTTVNMTKSSWDTTVIPQKVYLEKEEKETEKSDSEGTEEANIEIVDSDWYLSNGKYLYYYVKMHNNSDKTVVEHPSFRITARDENGNLLGTQDQVLSVLYPGQDFVFGSQAFSVDAMPKEVTFEPIPAKEYNLKDENTLDTFVPLEVNNPQFRTEKVVGEIVNKNDYEIDMACITVICKDTTGKIVDIKNTYADAVPANGSLPFEVSVFSKEEIATVDVYANQW